MSKINNLKNILIMRTDRIGEVLLSTVSIDVLKKKFPEARTSFVTSEYSKPLIEDRTDIEKIHTVNTFNKDKWISKAISLANELRKEKYDAVIILNPHKILHLAAFLAFIPHRIGYSKKWPFLLNDKTEDNREKGEKHEINYTMDLLKALDVDEEPTSPYIQLNTEAIEKVDNLLREKDISLEKPIVGIHPGSSNLAKLWPKDRYIELLRKIAEQTNAAIVLLGGKKEKALSRQIIQESGVNAIDLTGELNLKELAAFIGKTALFIGNDTGPMHMAAALDIPVIGIFGRNMPGVGPKRWGPWGKKHTVFHEDPGCDPCYDRECPYNYKCLKAIKVDAVFEEVKKRV